MARKFRELETKMSPEAIRTSDATYRRLKGTMALEELRDALRMTQQELATTLNVDQSAISKLEHRTDMYVSTLQRCIAAMGGQLEIRAVFPEGTVRISQFQSLAVDE
jgi:DNA-binding XRE family transcriptional regulator